MEPVYILMICAGGVFALLLLIYALYFREQKMKEERNRERIEEAYSDEHITKMEYDLAFYDEETRKILNGAPLEQVTIDELLNSNKQTVEAETKKTDEAIFNKIENEGVEEITGKYKG